MKRILLVTLLCVTGWSYAQVKMTGVVKDSIGTPLELANVIAINQETGGLESYGITNDKGKYVLSLGKNGSYKVQVTAIGLKTIEEIVTTKEADITKDFQMQLDNALDAVELTYEMPVTVKGDTLIYNADSFKNGSERKLEDVLEKLPGVEINEDGQIEVEGQVVQKVMVEGKDFFDGDTKLATKNIPSNVVDKIEVLKNYSEQRQLSGVRNNQNNVAINIKLKEGKTNFWFGDVTAGVGTSPDEGLYIVQPKLFYYSPKGSINIIADANNLGEPALTGRDLRGFGGGFRAPSRNSGTDLNIGNNGLGFLSLQNNQAERIETQLLATNFSYSPSEIVDLSGFAIYNRSRVEIGQNEIRTFTNDRGEEITESETDQANDAGLLKLSAAINPNFNNQIDYDVLGRITRERQDQISNSSVIGESIEEEKNDPYSINQNLNYYFTLNEKHIFAVEAQHLFQNEDPFYNAVVDTTNYQNTATLLGLDRNQELYDLTQERMVRTNQLDAKVDYYNVLNTKSNLNLFFGTIYNRQDFDSRLFQTLENGTVFDPMPIDGNTTINDVRYTFSDIYLGARYTAKVGKFTFAPAVSLHAYGNNNFQFGEKFGEDFYRVLPEVEIRYQIKNSETLTFRYNMTNQFTDVTRLAQGYVLTNLNNPTFGNPTLENGLSQNLNLTYRNFNLFNFTNIFAVINYSNRVDQIRNITSFFDNVVRRTTFFNSPFLDETLTAFGRYQRTWGKIRGELGVNLNYSKFTQIIQEFDDQIDEFVDVPSINETFVQTYTPGIRTNFREAPNVSFRYRYSIQDANQGENKTTVITNAPTIDFDAYIWDSVTIRSDYAYSRVSTSGEANAFDIWNASISYRKNRDANWEFQLRATNLLNTQSRITTSTNDNFVNISEYFIQPRFLSLRATYTL
ncbi:TonB-dependent receptor [Winogradskyella aurantiaca]|uniref:TonB-dependent receptor n=1 Tax=Winogradskyella aurantiaca TaxID=2219558 RepID=UPI000E1D5BCC|nr:TonB-dependent receptor [Winogradskyella aurantiaca]